MKSDDFEIVDTNTNFPAETLGKHGIDYGRMFENVRIDSSVINNLINSAAEVMTLREKTGSCIQILEEKRKSLKAQTDAYLSLLDAQTNSKIQKGELLQKLLQDYYQIGHNAMDAQSFIEIVKEFIGER